MTKKAHKGKAGKKARARRMRCACGGLKGTVNGKKDLRLGKEGRNLKQQRTDRETERMKENEKKERGSSSKSGV